MAVWLRLVSLASLAPVALGHVFNCGESQCVNRTQATVKVIVHGVEGDPFWAQFSAGVKQTARDMGVSLDFAVYPTFAEVSNMPDDIRATMNEPQPDVLLVSIPNDDAKDAVAEVIAAGIPVFGVNSGDLAAAELGVRGFVAMDEALGGFTAGQYFSEQLNGTDNVRALFFNDDSANTALMERGTGVVEGFPTATWDVVEVPLESVDTTASLTSQLEGCVYQVIQLATALSLDALFAAMNANGCDFDSTMIGTFDTSDKIYQALGNGQLAVTISQQTNLQASMAFLMAALFATSGKALAPPAVPVPGVYLSGPRLITRGSLPTDTVQTCQSEGYPVCPNTESALGGEASCACTDRSKIRIAGVTHGVTTDTFWDLVYAAMEQAGTDFGVDLDLVRLEPEETTELVQRRMANQISEFCRQDIDGIFVSIPSDVVIDAIKECQALNIPVISINSGASFAEELGLQQHIGQLEFSGGYAAGNRMIAAGVERGLCTMHEVNNVGLLDRCAGMETAFNETDGVEYLGAIDVPADNDAEYKTIVEAAIGEDGTWAGIGILVGGQVQVPPILAVQTDHPDLLIGSFDSSPELFTALEGNKILFGIDQNPYLQGYLPVPLLTWQAYTKEALINRYGESGPAFIERTPSTDEQACADVYFKACVPPEPPAPSPSSGGGGLSTGGIVGIAIAGAVVLFFLLFLLYRINKLSAHIAELEKRGESVPRMSMARRASSLLQPLSSVVEGARRDSMAAGDAAANAAKAAKEVEAEEEEAAKEEAAA